jgi:hypothetical protein
MIDVAAEFCFWTGQWENGSSVSSLGLAKTLDVQRLLKYTFLITIATVTAV